MGEAVASDKPAKRDRTGKWAVSFDEERYGGEVYDTKEQAIAAGMMDDTYPFWVGQCREPRPAENLWRADDWLEQVWCHDDYSGDCADSSFHATKDQERELEERVQSILKEWSEHHRLRPLHYCIETDSVEKIEKPPMPEPDWEWPSWIKAEWIAMDRSGLWYAYSSKPDQRSDFWYQYPEDYVHINPLLTDFTPPPCDDWTKSLMRNPNHEGDDQ